MRSIRPRSQRYQRNRRRCAAGLVAFALLGGCAGTPPAEDDWPASVPPRAYYAQLHSADAADGVIEPLDDYLTWVTRFYQGWGPFPYGWEAMTEAALDELPPERQTLVAIRLAHLGRLVSGEWAKSRARTRISNRALAAWAQAMNEAIERGVIEDLLQRAIADVEAILDGQLVADQIRFERYFPEGELEARDVTAHGAGAAPV